jgi:hypothetical protein
MSGVKKQDNRAVFEQYLHFVMMYANSASLARDLAKVNESDLYPGDLYIQPDSTGRGGVGHVSVLLDICQNDQGDRRLLFGYGFIPAQDFHLPRSGQDNGWFALEGYKVHVAAFGAGAFHRFDSQAASE